MGSGRIGAARAGLATGALLVKAVVFHQESDGSAAPDFTISALLVAGIKFPTGDSGRLKEEFHEVEIEDAPESGIHGHDLALGTGSSDGVLGGQVSARYRHLFFDGDAQFTWRGDGRHSYHFANDFAWRAEPGFFLVREITATFGTALQVSGEYKDTDRFQGRVAEDTGITTVYLGPRITGSYGRVSGDLAAEFPVSVRNTALQLVPDYRLRAAFSVSF